MRISNFCARMYVALQSATTIAEKIAVLESLSGEVETVLGNAAFCLEQVNKELRHLNRQLKGE